MKKIGFLLSGSGSTLENLLDCQKRGDLKGEVSVVISSKPGVFGLERAENNQIPNFVVEYKKYKNNLEEYSQKITKILIDYECELVVMGGFLSLYLIPEQFYNKVLNVHPALIPAFCGKGMFGMKVHKAVIESGVKVSGPTVHIVNNEYDKGPILMQGVVEILDSDTPELLAKKVQAKEREIYPIAINNMLLEKYDVQGNRVFLK